MLNQTSSLTPILPTYIDSTMISCFRSCPRKFFNEFILGLRPPGISIDLHAGGAFAHCVEVVRREIFVNGRTLSEALVRASAAFEIYWGDFVIPETKKTNKQPHRVWAAVEDYFKEYPPLTDHIQPYMMDGKPTIEFTFAIPLEPAIGSPFEGVDSGLWPLHPITGDPFLFVGRFDLLGEYLGVPIVCDDKTSGAGHYANWSEKWDLRGQFIGYTWACQQLGIPADSAAVRGVGIQMTKTALAEAIKPYSDDLRARWLEQLRRDLWRIVGMWNEQYFDYNFAESCVDYGNCIFSTSCQSATPELWLKNFEVRRWNPTKADPTSEAA
jgi:hypothetical protein